MNRHIRINGIHHITAISSTPSVNVAFYENILGLRLVKQTVNFDDPFTYHLYYGDPAGNPGTILTFFPWGGIPQGQNGHGMVTATAFEIPVDATGYWLDRLQRHGITTSQETRFGDAVIGFNDPHGLVLELVASGKPDPISDATAGGIESKHRIRGFHSATALLRSISGTHRLLTEIMGLGLKGREGNRYRFAMENELSLGCFYDLVVDPKASNSRQGSGTVHHIAFRTASDDEQSHWQKTLLAAGYPVTPVRDRKYFKSIYFNEPGGVLFEIATDPPGFGVDEPLERLGQSLMLPGQYEPMRPEIEKRLPALRSTEIMHAFIEPQHADTPDFTVVALHGTGGDEHDLVPLAQRIARGAAVISPRGSVIENGMNRFFRRLAPGVFDEQDIMQRANELADFLLEAAARYHRSADHLVALGYSNGANIAAAMLLLRPELFSKAILLRPMLPLNAALPGQLEGKEILVLRGASDNVIPAQSTDQLIRTLRAAGAQVDVIEIAAGHELTEADVAVARHWLEKATKPELAH